MKNFKTFTLKLALFLIFFLKITFMGVLANNTMDLEYDGKTHKYNTKPVTIKIENDIVKTGDMPAIIVNERTLVPAREVFESQHIAAKVDWIDTKKEVDIKIENTIIKLKINSSTAYVNNKAIELEVPAKLIRETSKKYAKTMIPLRFVLETLNYDVKWNEENYNVLLTKQKENVENQEAVVKVKDIKLKSLKNKSQFIIEADNKISSIKKSFWQDKIIIDINNASSQLKNNYSFNNSVINNIRTSQYSKDPMITRVVLNVENNKLNYKVDISDDKKSIQVDVSYNNIKEVSTSKNNQEDFISIIGDYSPDVKVINNQDQLVIEMPNSKLGIDEETISVDGQYIKEITTLQLDDKISRIKVQLREKVYFKIIKEDSVTTKIQISNNDYQNIIYKLDKYPTIILKKPDNITLNQLSTEDKYLQKKYVIKIPGNHLNMYDSTPMIINDNVINNIQFDINNKNETELIINTKKIYAYEIKEDKNNFIVTIMPPKDKYKKIIVIDAGHGGKDPGASKNGLVEKTLNLEITKYVKGYLDKELDIKAYYTRLDDTYPTLSERCKLANEVEADIFLSIHNNAFRESNLNGTETLYYKSQTKKQFNSKVFANILQNNLVNSLHLKNRGLKARNGLYVLRHTTMPAALVEVGFLTGSVDSKQLRNTSFKKTAAKAIYLSIVKAFNEYPMNR